MDNNIGFYYEQRNLYMSKKCKAADQRPYTHAIKTFEELIIKEELKLKKKNK